MTLIVLMGRNQRGIKQFYWPNYARIPVKGEVISILADSYKIGSVEWQYNEDAESAIVCMEVVTL